MRTKRHQSAGFASVLLMMCGLTSLACAGAASMTSLQTGPGRVRPWPCRLVVKPTLLGIVEDGWKRSPTLQQQCRELADARSVVVMEWGRMTSQTRATTKMTDSDGVVVATVQVPPLGDVIELVAHELEHVLERTRGIDLALASRRGDSGVWKSFDGFETQKAIDVGRQVAQEVKLAAR